MSRKFVYQLGVALGASGKSSRPHKGRAPRRSAAQKREEGALLLRQENERRKTQELKKAMKKDEGLMAACKEEAVKRGHRIHRERGNRIFDMVHDFFFSVETDIKQENERLEQAMENDDYLKDICIKETVKRGHKLD
jgi:hypothetical protein